MRSALEQRLAVGPWKRSQRNATACRNSKTPSMQGSDPFVLAVFAIDYLHDAIVPVTLLTLALTTGWLAWRHGG